jgi:hypothetical protein
MNALQHARIYSHRVEVLTPLPTRYWEQPAPSPLPTRITESVPGVRVEMPLTDWEDLLSVYQSHYQPQSQHPTVKEAWTQYKMAVALTQRF